MREEIREYIEREILPRYDHHDAAHQRDHAATVISQSLAIVAELKAQGEDVDEESAEKTAALFGELMEDAEISTIRGGQPVYSFIVSVE